MDSRFHQRDQKRKLNKIYNIAITIVSILIVIVAATIFLSYDDPVDQATTEPKHMKEKKQHKAEKTDEKEDAPGAKEEEDDQATETTDSTDEEQDKDVELVEETSADSNVKKAYTSEDWQPVGTEQSGEHVTSFEKDSTDWNEMRKAIAVGAGVDESSMKLWWLQNGGSPNTAIGTASDGNESQTYRVHIEWVDGSGWKPVKVEELNENDKK